MRPVASRWHRAALLPSPRSSPRRRRRHRPARSRRGRARHVGRRVDRRWSTPSRAVTSSRCASLSAGEPVRKYGRPIGRATAQHRARRARPHAQSGDAARRRGRVSIRAAQRASTTAPTAEPLTFMGYRRADGRVGTRNEIWILCTVGCVGRTAERIARLARRRFARPRRWRVRVPASVRLLAARRRSRSHAQAHRRARPPSQCRRRADPRARLRIESARAAAARKFRQSQRAHIRTFARAGDERRNRRRTARSSKSSWQIAERVEREPCPLAALVVGLKCGGSDGFSGITANPLVGRIADRVTGAGGTAILTEIPEIFGAEQLLMERAARRTGVRRHRRRGERLQALLPRNDQPVHENPSPGNIAGGITTLEEKSLGAVQKGGHATVTQVLRYGERVDAPGPRAARSAGQRRRLVDRARRGRRDDPAVHDRSRHAARLSGADAEDQLELARSRRTSRTGSTSTPAACSTRRSATRWRTTSCDLIVDDASGRPARNELNEEREIAIWKDGVTL